MAFTVKSHKFDLGRLQEARASNIYHQYYNNYLYAKAVDGKSNQYANQLINEALAICGNPHYKLSNRKWSDEALAFLKVFARN